MRLVLLEQYTVNCRFTYATNLPKKKKKKSEHIRMFQLNAPVYGPSNTSMLWNSLQ